MTLQEFVKKYNGKSVDYDGMYGSQCQDLALFWETENWWPTIHGNAIDTPNTFDKSFYQWIVRNNNIPSPGDLVIWNYKPYGHIAIFVNGDANNFTSFDQNYPVGSACHLQNHNYNNVIGWIHPKGSTMELSNKNAYSLGSDARYFHLTMEEAVALKVTPLKTFPLYGTDFYSYGDRIMQGVASQDALREIGIPKNITKLVKEGSNSPDPDQFVPISDYDAIYAKLQEAEHKIEMAKKDLG